jgi:hypothetical protein
MSKQHQASRRRSYGRRQHEIHERTPRPAGLLDWLDAGASDESMDRAGLDRLVYTDARVQQLSRGAD